MGNEVEIIAPAISGIPKKQNLEGLIVTRIPAIKFLQTPIPVTLQNFFSTTPGFDIINAHTPVPIFADGACLMNKAMKNNPFVLTFRTIAIKKKPPFSWLSNMYYRTFHKVIVNFSDHLIAISEILAHWLRSQGVDPGKISTVFNGLDQSIFNPSRILPDLRKSLGIPVGTKILLYAGRFEEDKGILILMDCIKRLKHLKDKICFLLVGDGSLKPKLDSFFRKYNLWSMVKMLAPIPHDRIGYYYNESDFVVMPSLFEGFGNTVIEAFASDTVLIASKAGAIPEKVTHQKNGLLVEPNNPQRLKEAIEKILFDESTAQKLNENAKKEIQNIYSWTKVAEQTQKAYERAIIAHSSDTKR